MSQRNNRWVNWDQLSIGEDFWDVLDDVDEKRIQEIKEEKQMSEIRRTHEKRLRNYKIDMSKFEEEEPYASMCKKPQDEISSKKVPVTWKKLSKKIARARAMA